MTDTKLLADAIAKSGLKKGHLAEKVGLSRAGFNNCLNNKAEFKASQIDTLSELLGLNVEQRLAIFFAKHGV